jgi:hypothetical protein
VSRRAVRQVAGTLLLSLAVVAAVTTVASRAGTDWLQAFFMWITIALLTWGLTENDRKPPGGLP